MPIDCNTCSQQWETLNTENTQSQNHKQSGGATCIDLFTVFTHTSQTEHGHTAKQTFPLPASAFNSIISWHRKSLINVSCVSMQIRVHLWFVIENSLSLRSSLETYPRLEYSSVRRCRETGLLEKGCEIINIGCCYCLCSWECKDYLHVATSQSGFTTLVNGAASEFTSR